MPKQKGFVETIIAVFVLTLGIIALFYFYKHNATQKPNAPSVETSIPTTKPTTVCTQEAKLCADGSYVAREGATCEFKACPIGTTPSPIAVKPCGGFGGESGEFACQTGYYCKYPSPMYPDASGICIKN